jgi:small subunit ribosomal protein S6
VRNYEIIYILKPGMEEEAINAAVARFEEVITNGGGEIVKTNRWGNRRLAYPIDDINEGYYVLMNIKSESTTSQELERVLRLQDDVLRQLVIKIDE